MRYLALKYQLFNVECFLVVKTYHIVISHVACHCLDRVCTVQTVRVKSRVAAPKTPHGNHILSG